MKIYIAGHKGFVGNALLKKMQREYPNAQFLLRSRNELDLLDQKEVFNFLTLQKPDIVIIAAAKVGGIMANMTHQADFIYENLQIQNNLIHGSYLAKVKKLLFLGSSCIYPVGCPQPIKEEYLMTGDVERTNYGYAMAKIAGIKMCEAYKEQYGCNFFAVQPTNLYGIGDDFHPEYSHALAGMMRKIHEAKINNQTEVILWGTGTPRREWLYIDDLIDAIIFLLKNDICELSNIGCGYDFSITELAKIIKDVVKFKGEIKFDTSKPDGVKQKLLNISKMQNLGWTAKTEIKDGISSTYEWFCKR